MDLDGFLFFPYTNEGNVVQDCDQLVLEPAKFAKYYVRTTSKLLHCT